jgi:hypothetical protein
MKLIATFKDIETLKQGDKLRKQYNNGHTEYEVNYNNTVVCNIDLLILPLLTPDIVIVGEEKIINDKGEISGGFPIQRTYNDLIDGTWFII